MTPYQVSAHNEYISYRFLCDKILSSVKAVCCLPWSQAIILNFRIFEISFPLTYMMIQIMFAGVYEVVYSSAIGK